MIKRMITILNAAIHYSAMAVIGFLILLIPFGIYGAIKLKWAKSQVAEFEQKLTIGAPIEGLKKKAEEMHLNFRTFSNSNDKDGKFYVWEGFVFSRWFCDVEYQNGKVKAKKVRYLD